MSGNDTVTAKMANRFQKKTGKAADNNEQQDHNHINNNSLQLCKFKSENKH